MTELKRLDRLIPKFCRPSIPAEKDHGVLYISTEYKVAVHLCACGCGVETVTPLRPGDWQLNAKAGDPGDADIITLHPSIGNQRLPCRSHYWIRENRIEWCK